MKRRNPRYFEAKVKRGLTMTCSFTEPVSLLGGDPVGTYVEIVGFKGYWRRWSNSIFFHREARYSEHVPKCSIKVDSVSAVGDATEILSYI